MCTVKVIRLRDDATLDRYPMNRCHKGCQYFIVSYTLCDVVLEDRPPSVNGADPVVPLALLHHARGPASVVVLNAWVAIVINLILANVVDQAQALVQDGPVRKLPWETH